MDSKEKSLWLALVGSVLLIVGVFLPLMSSPRMGSFNYFRNGSGDGAFVLVLGAVSVVLAITGRYRGLWGTGVGSLLLLGFTFWEFRKVLQGLGPETTKLMSPELQWGWGVLLAGSILVLAAASLHPLTIRQKNITAALTVIALLVMAVAYGIGRGVGSQVERGASESGMASTAPLETASRPAPTPNPEPTVDCSSYTPDMPSGVQIIVGMRDNVFAVHREFKTSPAVISYLLVLKSMRAKGRLSPCAGIPYTTPGGHATGAIYLLGEHPSDGELRDFQNQDFTEVPLLSFLYGYYRWDASDQEEAAVGFERNGRQYNGYRRIAL